MSANLSPCNRHSLQLKPSGGGGGGGGTLLSTRPRDRTKEDSITAFMSAKLSPCNRHSLKLKPSGGGGGGGGGGGLVTA